MYTIRKEFAFSAAHHLRDLPADHPCAEPHGHNYVVTVELKSDKLNEVGFVKDYRELQLIKNWLDLNFDHKDLNKMIGINPTAENIAKLLYDTFYITYPMLVAIEVSETPKTSARYER